jgi:hypothetical protein
VPSDEAGLMAGRARLRCRILRAALVAAALIAATARADVPLSVGMSVERLSNGNTLIADGGTVPASCRLIEVDSLGRLAWAYVRSDIPWAHTARRLANGNTLISATMRNLVIEVDARGDPVWQANVVLNYPNEAIRLLNGNTLITDRDNNRVIEVTPAGDVAWKYSNLFQPHNGNRLASGNTLICDSERNRVVEVDSARAVVWQCTTGLSGPRSAQRLTNGNTLIADSRNNRVVEVDIAGVPVWSYTEGIASPYMAVRLENGNTLISSSPRVLEVNQSGDVIWQYPPLAGVAVETLWVINPSSGCSLYAHIHRPITNPPNRKLPAVILVPDLSDSGAVYDSSRLADHIASDGFAVLHFDADGRGRSGGTEDYNGRVHQDGLRSCATALLARDYVDSSALGIFSRGYGIVMATGMLARYATSRVKFLLDFEGPSDRYQVCAESGGHVPMPVDSEAFWAEREAGRSIKRVSGAYLRIQTEYDHTGRIPDNRHAIALIDSATSTAHGGAGIAAWTRVNDSVMNPVNHVYTAPQPPEWIEEFQEANILCRELLYLHELADSAFVLGMADAPRSPSLAPRPPSLTITPNPSRGHVSVRIPQLQTANCKRVTIYDASGRLVQSAICNLQSAMPLDLRSMPAGVYHVRWTGDRLTATAKLIVD